MKTSLLLSWLICLMVPQKSYSQSVSSTTLQKGYKDWYIGDFRCGVYIPPSYDPSRKYPLVVYLHGKSDTITRNIGWYGQAAVLADPCIVLTPKCPLSETGEWGNSHSKEIPPMVEKMFEMISLVQKQYTLDENRFYIYGISMGAIGTFGIIQKFPDVFAAGYAICGWGTRDVAPSLSKIPFWIFHGDQDDVVPVEGSRQVYQAVLAYGGKKIRYTELKGVKHDAQNYLPEDQLYQWLLRQRKGGVYGLPDNVGNVKAKVKDKHTIVLQWEKPLAQASSEKEVWYYKIYRDNRLVGEVDGKNFTFVDSLNQHQSRYVYKLSAVNYYFKESAVPTSLQVKAVPD
jgi:pimeloyl-ACP methyl ester carboxylesterase